MPEKHSIGDIVREITNPESFSEAGQDVRCCRIERSPDGQTLRHVKSLLGRLIPGRSRTHFAVYLHEIPTAVGPWTFDWSEGVSKLGMRLEGRFTLQVKSEEGAVELVKLLASRPDLGGALHRLIGTRLHVALGELLRECELQGANLLSRFEGSGLGDSESPELNRRVTKAVGDALGSGVAFEVRFTLRNKTPLHVPIARTDTFKEGGSGHERSVVTTARVELTNYQAFQKSGLEGEEQVRREIEGAIQLAVQQHLFGRSYFELVEGLRTQQLQTAMTAQVAAAARRIGFEVRMFQTAPTIPALLLAQQQRIEIDATEELYYPAASTGAVQFKTTLLVQLVDGLKLNLLLSPDDAVPLDRIKLKVREICRDNIRRVDRRAVNLHFDDKVEPMLCDAIRTQLAKAGLETLDVHLRQERTEDGERHEALCSMTVDFSCEVTSRGQSGHLLPVVVKGRIQPRGTTEGGWNLFETQDFGFRRDSKRADAELRRFGDGIGLAVPPGGSLQEAQRRTVALHMELDHMRQCVEDELREHLAAEFPDLPAAWQADQESAIAARARELAKRAVLAQFGMLIEVHGFRRDVTSLELTQRQRTETMLELARQKDLQTKAHALERQRVVNEAEIARVTDASRQQQESRQLMTSAELRKAEEEQRALLKADGQSLSDGVEDLMKRGMADHRPRLENKRSPDDGDKA